MQQGRFVVKEPQVTLELETVPLVTIAKHRTISLESIPAQEVPIKLQQALLLQFQIAQAVLLVNTVHLALLPLKIVYLASIAQLGLNMQPNIHVLMISGLMPEPMHQEAVSPVQMAINAFKE